MLLFKFHSSLVDDDLVYVSRKKLEKEKNLQNTKPESIVDLSMIDRNFTNQSGLHS